MKKKLSGFDPSCITAVFVLLLSVGIPVVLSVDEELSTMRETFQPFALIGLGISFGIYAGALICEFNIQARLLKALVIEDESLRETRATAEFEVKDGKPTFMLLPKGDTSATAEGVLDHEPGM